MEESNLGVKEPEAPPVEPVKKPEENPPAPAAGEEGKDNTQSVLEEANLALLKAERRIVELKRELKTKDKTAGSESSLELADLSEKVSNLESRIIELQENLSFERDKSLEEIQMSRKKISELSAALVSKATLGKGEGSGSNQDQLKPPPPEPEPLAKTPQEVAILERRGLDKYGKPIKK